jgi:glycine cleavage system H protein
MSDVPEELLYTKEHEWVLVEDGKATIGITDFAQDELTDVVYVELPEVGTEVERDGELGALESVKAVSEVYSPVSGTVREVNSDLESSPELINDDPYGKGWFAVLAIKDASELEGLMDAAAYRRYIGE